MIQFDEKFWIAFSFVAFIALLYKKLSKIIVSSLDEKTKAISDQLNQAKKIKEEAKKLEAEYKKQEKEINKEAASIIKNAQKTADEMLKKAEKDIKNMIAQKTKQSEELIKSLEKQTINEIKSEILESSLRDFADKAKDKSDKTKLLASSLEKLKDAI
ncbi:MAG: hypothetical protein ISP24_04040 [Rickettsiales bacterium]|nr:hypothetical protein [Rickettsiales bacterium]